MQLHGVSVDPPSDAKKVVELQKLAFPILCDEDRSVIRKLGIVHPAAGPGGGDVPIPALFLIGRDGRILWRHVASHVQDRLDPKTVLEEVRRAIQ